MVSFREKERLIYSFLEIAVGQTDQTARKFLQATSWKLEEAVELFYIRNEYGMITLTRPDHVAAQSWGDEDEVRAPLPFVRETFYDDSTYYSDFVEEFKSSSIWERDESTSSASTSAPRDSLASLYRPPFDLMFHGSFEQAKAASSSQDKWLLVNLQSNTVFSSHMLNRDTWANEAVSRTIKASFTFWQVSDNTTQGKKVCTFYKLESIPAVLVIDPTTGQKMKMWSGMVEPETLLEDLVPFLDSSPSEHLASRPRGNFSFTPHSKPKDDAAKDEDKEELQLALAASMEDNNMKGSSDDQSPEEVVVQAVTTMVLRPLPAEPKGDRSSVHCRIRIRLPNGQRLQRNFLKTDSIQLLWSFCYSELEESERKKPLKLTQAIPGGSKRLDYDSNLTLERSGVANSMISASWE